MICWDCKHYIRSKPILFGLGQSKSECDKGLFTNKEPKTCKFYIRSNWKRFWDRVTRPV